MTKNIDALIAESQSIRDDLLRTLGKLEAFSLALSEAAEELTSEVTTNAGNCEKDASESSDTDGPTGD